MAGPSLVLGACSICFDRLTVTWPTRTETLTPLEAAFLLFLHQADGGTVSQQTALAQVWGYHADVRSRAVALCVTRLRKKVEPDPAAPVWLLTVRGRGYRLVSKQGPTPNAHVVRAEHCLRTMDHAGGWQGLSEVQSHWDVMAAALETLPDVDAVRVATALGECSWRLDVSHPPESIWKLHNRLKEGPEKWELRVALARVCWQSGATEAAEELVASVLDPANTDRPNELSLLVRAGILGAWTSRLAGEHAVAKHRAESAYRRALRWGDRGLIGAAADQMASVLYDLGDYSSARLWFEDALRALNQTDDVRGVGQCRNNFGVMLYETGDVDGAVPHIEAAIHAYEAERRPLDASVAMANLAMMLLAHQRLEGAQRWAQRAEQIQLEQGGAHGLSHAVRILGRVAADRNELDTAQRLFERAAHLGRQAGLAIREAYAMLDLGWTQHARGNIIGARASYNGAYTIFEASNTTGGLALLSLWWAGLERSDVQLRQAIHYLSAVESPLLALVRGEPNVAPSYVVRRTQQIAGTPAFWLMTSHHRV